MFRCAVVSRKHAKIALSDSGHAYLIDLGSHHGTHVRKRGEGTSKILKPETPALLTDGDVVTFGKAVGKGEECVRPITARVELLYGAQALSSIKPLVVPSSSTNSSPLSSSDRSSNKTTGRYGVHSSPSSSDDSSAPNSDQYSDIEEIPAPASAVKVASPDHDDGHIGRAFEVLKHLLPPSHTPCTPIRGRSPAIELFDSPSRTRWLNPPPHPSFPSRWPTPPPLQPSSPSYFQHSPPYSPRSLSWPDSPSPPFSNYDPVGFDASQHDIFEAGSNRSCLSSPMDLASPSPGPLISVLPPVEPSMVGAWPASRSSVSSAPGTPEPESHSTNQPESLSVSSEQVQSLGGEQKEAVLSESHEQVAAAVEPPASLAESDDLYAPAKAPEEVVKQPEPAGAGFMPMCEVEPIIAELNALKTNLHNLQNDVTALQKQRRQPRPRYNNTHDMHTLEEKVSDFDDRLLDVDSKYITLADQVEGMMHIDIPDLLSQIEALQDQAENVTHVDIADLQDQVDVLEEAQAALRSECEKANKDKEEMKLKTKREEEEAKPFGEREDVKSCLQTMRDMVDEIRNLRDRAEKQTTADLEAVRKIRDEMVTCQAETSGYRDEVEVYWDETSCYRNDADDYRADAEACRDDVLAYRDEMRFCRDAVIAHRDEAMAHLNQTRVYRNETLAHRDGTMLYCNQTLANIAAREEVMAAQNTNTAVAAAAETTPVLTSLKRKRDDTDENEVGDEVQSDAVRIVAVAVGPDGDDAVMKEEKAAPLADSSTSKPTPADGPRRPRKRARKFAKAFVQTATAVTLGAVVTWSALAFS